MSSARILYAAVVLAVLAMLVPLTPAHAGHFHHHDGYYRRLAHCESTHRWHHYNGGGLQIIDSTWAAYGGRRYAPVAEQATRRQQIRVARNVMAGQGDEAWPYCGDAVR